MQEFGNDTSKGDRNQNYPRTAFLWFYVNPKELWNGFARFHWEPERWRMFPINI